MDPDERRFKQTACMRHQDVAKALGLDTLKEGTHGVEFRPGNPETGEGRGVPLYYTGVMCPLCCSAKETMIHEVQRTTARYRVPLKVRDLGDPAYDPPSNWRD